MLFTIFVQFRAQFWEVEWVYGSLEAFENIKSIINNDLLETT